eukprot:6423272-Heterocapsa_arctica.AAC.1
MSTGLLSLTYWTFGFWMSGAFVFIKLVYFLRLPETFFAALQTAKEMYDLVDQVTLLAGDYREMHEAGDLDTFYLGAGVA